MRWRCLQQADIEGKACILSHLDEILARYVTAGHTEKENLMSLWLWIGLPLLFLLGLFLNAIKDMKQLEKAVAEIQGQDPGSQGRRGRLTSPAGARWRSCAPTPAC
jgi:hypothetical protein